MYIIVPIIHFKCVMYAVCIYEIIGLHVYGIGLVEVEPSLVKKVTIIFEDFNFVFLCLCFNFFVSLISDVVWLGNFIIHFKPICVTVLFSFKLD